MSGDHGHVTCEVSELALTLKHEFQHDKSISIPYEHEVRMTWKTGSYMLSQGCAMASERSKAYFVPTGIGLCANVQHLTASMGALWRA